MRLFPDLIGAAFAELPAAVRAVHCEAPRSEFTGRCRVERGAGWLASLMARLASLPRAGDDVAVRVRIDRDRDGETWVREFDGRRLTSRLWRSGECLEEKLGAATLRVALRADRERITWEVVGARVAGVPLPVSWFQGVEARESSENGRYRFDIRARLPLVGLLVSYGGTLDVGA